MEKYSKKKVSLITRHSYPNYGSLLQAYSLQESIKNLGHEAEYINYRRADEKGGRLASKGVKVSGYANNFLKKCLYYVIQTPNFYLMNKKFKNFQNILVQSKEYEVMTKNDFPISDVYCVGSDQVWNKIMGDYDLTYFLDFIPEDKYTISYSSSFGTNKIADDSKVKITRELSKFNKITVREDSGVELLNDLGIKGSEVVDPVLLQTKQFWEEFSMNTEKFKLPTNPYMLIYQLHNTDGFSKKLEQLSNELNLEIIRVTPDLKQKIREKNVKYLVTPNEFLALFKNANYVVTDSFHGTLFSLIFEKSFTTVIPNENQSRITSILSKLDLENRISIDDNNSNVEYIDDWASINRNLEKMRDDSIELLSSMIKDADIHE